MLAKAVATEAGANFMSISMSSIGSKWFGEGEKYAKYLPFLLPPPVLFPLRFGHYRAETRSRKCKHSFPVERALPHQLSQSGLFVGLQNRTLRRVY